MFEKTLVVKTTKPSIITFVFSLPFYVNPQSYYTLLKEFWRYLFLVDFVLLNFGIMDVKWDIVGWRVVKIVRRIHTINLSETTHMSRQKFYCWRNENSDPNYGSPLSKSLKFRKTRPTQLADGREPTIRQNLLLVLTKSTAPVPTPSLLQRLTDSPFFHRILMFVLLSGYCTTIPTV